MKELFKYLVITILAGWFFYGAYLFARKVKKDSHEEKYCGTVKELYRVDAAYKRSGSVHIVFYAESLNKYIDVSVTRNCYVNTEVGEYVCFTLTNRQIK